MTRREFPLLREQVLTERLPNGLTVCVLPRPGFRKKLAFLAVHYGSIDTSYTCGGVRRTSPDGVAHYLEHKMFDLPEGNAMDRFAMLGGRDNAFTSYDITAYYVECVENFQQNLEQLLRMVATPWFTDESVEKERGIIEQEIRMYEDSPSSVVFENLFSAIWARHPVRVPIAGTVQSVREITAQTLRDCYDAFYTPANMMLCVAGDVDAQSVAEAAQRLLPAQGAAPAVSDYGQEPGPLPACSRVCKRMEVSMPTFALGFVCDPPAPGGVLEQEIVADLAADLLLGESSELYSQLYEQGLIDSGFSCGFEAVAQASALIVSGDSRDPEAVLAAITRRAERLCREGADEKLFQRLKRAAIGGRIRSLDGFESICYRQSAYFFEGVSYYDFPEVYARVTQQQVLDFLRTTIRPERAALSLVLPLEKGETK